MRRVGLYLDRPVFSHGQLYVAFSRVSDPKNLSLFLDEEKHEHGFQNGFAYTRNDVFKGLLTEEVDKLKQTEYWKDGPEEFAEGTFFIINQFFFVLEIMTTRSM